MTPQRMPTNWFSIFLNAAGTCSSGIDWIYATTFGFNSVVTTR